MMAKMLMAVALIISTNLCDASSFGGSLRDGLKIRSEVSVMEIIREQQVKTIVEKPVQMSSLHKAMQDLLLTDRGLKKNLDNSVCQCQKNTCGCCVHLKVDKIHLDDNACLNITYLPGEIGFEFDLTLNGKVIYKDKISVKNPPAICASIPYVGTASICIKFYNLDFQHRQLSGCADIKVEVEHAEVLRVHVGCFHIPPAVLGPQDGITAVQPVFPLTKRIPTLQERDEALQKLFQLLTMKDVDLRDDSMCGCHNYTCGCCLHVTLKAVGINDTVCTQVTYLPDEYGIEVDLLLDGKVLFSKKLSAKNPPPICAAIPYLRKVASLCLRFYNLDVKNKTFSGCVDLEAALEGEVIEKLLLGCFKIPLCLANC